jgi:hypothetical protein
MRHRALAAAAGMGLLFALCAPGVAGAAAPEHILAPEQHVEFAAGMSCPFTSRWDTIDNHSQQLTFPTSSNGDQRILLVGESIIRVTNVQTGESIEVVSGGRIDLTFHADTTVTIDISGRILGAYFPTDVGGPGMFLFLGRLHDEALADFTIVSHSFNGQVTDLCSELAP